MYNFISTQVCIFLQAFFTRKSLTSSGYVAFYVKNWKSKYFLLLFLSGSLFAEEIGNDITLDLLHPRYEDGMLITEEGGVLCGENLRIQAKNIQYCRKPQEEPPIFNLTAGCNLLIDYGDLTIVGDSMQYDFIKKEGCILNGKTAVVPWYIGGDRIFITQKGDIVFENGYITTSEGGENDVILRAAKLHLTCDKILTAESISFHVKDIPVLYLPFIKLDVKSGPRSPFSFTAGWGGFLGTYVSARYEFLSGRCWNAFLRLDGYLGRGLGGGVETEYESDQRLESLYTRSYYAHDISIDDPLRRDRYRFQGVYNLTSSDERGWINLVYDVLSDDEMANDYPPYSFELGTAERTEFEIHTQNDSWIANFHTRVRVNSFQSINQELPSLEVGLHPFEIGETGFIVENLMRAGYLSYVFSDQVIMDNIDDDFGNFHAFRFEANPKIYRPMNFGPINVTPEAGFVGIAYSDSQTGSAVGQAVGDFNVLMTTEIVGNPLNARHIVEPYIHYHLLTHPTVSLHDYYLFTINDGYHALNLLTFGVGNAILTSPCSSQLTFDVWANAFLNTNHTVPQAIPKGYFSLGYQPHPRLVMGLDSAWNFAHHQVDFYNVMSEWTLHENIALALEYRHRSRYDWRKADFYNFILEATQPESELLLSPLSDRRDIAMARIFVRLNPDWDVQLQVRRGWNREQEFQGPYLEYRAEVGHVMFQHYQLRLSYEKRQADHRFWVTFKLDPPPPRKRCC